MQIQFDLNDAMEFQRQRDAAVEAEKSKVSTLFGMPQAILVGTDDKNRDARVENIFTILPVGQSEGSIQASVNKDIELWRTAAATGQLTFNSDWYRGHSWNLPVLLYRSVWSGGGESVPEPSERRYALVDEPILSCATGVPGLPPATRSPVDEYLERPCDEIGGKQIKYMKKVVADAHPKLAAIRRLQPANRVLMQTLFHGPHASLFWQQMQDGWAISLLDVSQTTFGEVYEPTWKNSISEQRVVTSPFFLGAKFAVTRTGSGIQSRYSGGRLVSRISGLPAVHEANPQALSNMEHLFNGLPWVFDPNGDPNYIVAEVTKIAGMIRPWSAIISRLTYDEEKELLHHALTAIEGDFGRRNLSTASVPPQGGYQGGYVPGTPAPAPAPIVQQFAASFPQAPAAAPSPSVPAVPLAPPIPQTPAVAGAPALPPLPQLPQMAAPPVASAAPSPSFIPPAAAVPPAPTATPLPPSPPPVPSFGAVGSYPVPPAPAIGNPLTPAQVPNLPF